MCKKININDILFALYTLQIALLIIYKYNNFQWSTAVTRFKKIDVQFSDRVPFRSVGLLSTVKPRFWNNPRFWNTFAADRNFYNINHLDFGI